MEAALEKWVTTVVMLVEAAAVLLIAAGAAEALWQTAAAGFNAPLIAQKRIWVHFARWLLLALEFQLAADILKTAIQPSWNDIGQLAAIAAIRTFLGFFLERDMTTVQYDASGEPVRAVPPTEP